jgi:hypothetical protein
MIDCVPYSLDDRLVIGIASSALFDLTESGAVFNQQGESAYRTYQEANLNNPLQPGVAFQFVKRLLKLNDLSPAPDDPLDPPRSPDTGVMRLTSAKLAGTSAACASISRWRRISIARHGSAYLCEAGKYGMRSPSCSRARICPRRLKTDPVSTPEF